MLDKEAGKVQPGPSAVCQAEMLTSGMEERRQLSGKGTDVFGILQRPTKQQCGKTD